MPGLCAWGRGGANIRRKKTERMARFFYEIGAQEKTRTSTTVRSLAPEASVSTNFTTWAFAFSSLLNAGGKIRSWANLVNQLFELFPKFLHPTA